MPNGFSPTICRLIWPVDPIPTRRRGQARAEGSPSRREASGRRKRGGTNELARAARANEPAKRPQRIKLLRIGAGIRPPPPGGRVGSTPWRIRLARPDPRFASSGGKEERNGAETWERRLSDFVGSVAGPSERRGEGGGGRGESRKKGEKKRKGRKKYVGPDGAKRKKNGEPRPARPALCGAGGKKKKKPCGFFFSAFRVGASGRLNPAKRVNLACSRQNAWRVVPGVLSETSPVP